MSSAQNSSSSLQEPSYHQFLVPESAARRFMQLVLGLLSFLVGLVGLIFATHARFDNLKYLLLAISSLPISWSLLACGQRMLARRAQTVLRKHKEPPIIYLRSFVTDARWLQHPSDLFWMVISPGRLESPEESLCKALRGVGPLIAIGNPGEMIPPSGAARMYVQHDKWQYVVEQLAKNSQFVIFRSGATEGFWWEVDHAVKNCDPRTVLIYLPPEDCSTVYSTLRERAATVLPKLLPAELGQACFVAFDDEWTPRLLPQTDFRRRSKLRQFLAGSRAPCIRDGINEALSALNKPTRKMRFTFAEWFAYAAVLILLCLPVLLLMSIDYQREMRRIQMDVQNEASQLRLDEFELPTEPEPGQ